MIRNILFLTLFTLVLFSSCDESVQDKETNPGQPNISESDTIADTTSGSGISSLIKTDTGLFRGATLGMSRERIKGIEQTSQLEEDTEEYLDYIINYNFPESAEIIYYFDQANQLNKIEAIIFPSDKEAQKNTYDQLITYYSDRYGEATNIKGDTIRWQSNLDNIMVLLSKQDGQKMHDINLIFRPIDKKAAKKGI